MRFRSLLNVLFLAVILVSGSCSAPVVAQNATPSAAGVVLSPDAKVDGLSLGEWSARSWQWSFSFPNDANPFSDETGERCGFGQSGPVFFLAGADHSVARSCVVPLGVNIFVPIIGSECSTVEPPPFFGRDEAELRRCATGNVTMAERVLDMSVMQLTVDGQAIDDLSAYRAATPLFTLWLPKGNALGSDKMVANSVADGYQVMLNPLPEGDHVVVITFPGGPGQTLTITYKLTVQSDAYANSPATPDVFPTPAGSPTASAITFDGQIDVGGGRMLHVRCAGRGSPTVVFEEGGPDDVGASTKVGALGFANEIAGLTRFCAYDRAFQGSSDPAPAGPRTLRDSAADLHALLSSPELACPCVLVGESMGGAITLILAATHPDDIAGLVLLDPPPPGFIDRALEIAPADSPEADLANGVPNPEHLDFVASLRQVETPVLPTSVPVVLLTHGVGYPPICPCSPDYPADELEAWWQQAQTALAEALHGKLVVAEGSSHYIETDRPAFIVDATHEVVNAVRDPST
ncbi:MAG: alpha/beta fold hydrolase [Thermomicrobiales bacterium]